MEIKMPNQRFMNSRDLTLIYVDQSMWLLMSTVIPQVSLVIQSCESPPIIILVLEVLAEWHLCVYIHTDHIQNKIQ